MTNGANHEVLQQINRVLVLSILRNKKVTTRAEIAKMTGLQRATITNIINDFIRCDIVRETGIMDGVKGRRCIGITLNGARYSVIAIRLARMHFTIGLFDVTGSCQQKKKVPLNMMDGSRVAMEVMEKEIRKLLDNRDVISIGIALPGPYLKTENRIAHISDFPGWENVDVSAELEERFHIPVLIEHDGNASTLAEWWFGGHCSRNKVLLNVIAGQGNGAGVIQDDRLFVGGHGFAGELGHTSISFDGPKCGCGNHGCLDLYCSSIVLLRNIRSEIEDHPESLLAKQPLTKENVAAAAAAGDKLAVQEIQKMGRFLGYGIVNAINTYDPDVVVIGDEMAAIGGEILLRSVRESVKKRVLPILYDNLEIKLSELEDSILLGAMAVAIDNAFQELRFIKVE